MSIETRRLVHPALPKGPRARAIYLEAHTQLEITQIAGRGSRNAQVRLGLIGCAVSALSWETLGVSIRWRSFYGDTYPYNVGGLARLACYPAATTKSSRPSCSPRANVAADEGGQAAGEATFPTTKIPGQQEHSTQVYIPSEIDPESAAESRGGSAPGADPSRPAMNPGS
jgi:hypothetical protein